MSAPSRKVKRNPRRKAGVRSRKRKSRILRFNLTIEAQKMLVIYKPAGVDVAQFEFKSLHRPARRILVSETGYRSQFVLLDDVKAAHGPKAFARSYALEFLEHGTRRDPRQLPLF